MIFLYNFFFSDIHTNTNINSNRNSKPAITQFDFLYPMLPLPREQAS